MHSSQSSAARVPGTGRALRATAPRVAVCMAASLAAMLLLDRGAAEAADRGTPAAGFADYDACRQKFVAGRYRDCIAAAERALQGQSRLEDWAALKAEAELAVGEYRRARATVEAGLKRSPANLRLVIPGHRALVRLGESERAHALLREIDGQARRAPWRFGSPDDLLVLGECALNMGADPRFVLEGFYEPAQRLAPDRREPHLAIGRLALDQRDFDLAAETFETAAAKFPRDPEIQFGLSLAWAPERPDDARRALEKALAGNPHLVPALLYQVDRMIDAEQYEEATALLDRVKAVNPHEPDAWAFRAVIGYLMNDATSAAASRQAGLAVWPQNPAVDHLIGLKLSQKYRFTEGSESQRKALQLDPRFVPARVQLCQDLLRLGKEAEGWKLAEAVRRADRNEVVTYNLLELRDRIAKFRTLQNEHFVVRMSAEESDVYGERVLALLDRARKTLCEKYDLQLNEKVIVEIFPDETDFAVRTFGMPGTSGFLGVCFGKVITANSPASQTEHPANWEAVLWHEFCHVVTLELTQNRMPRWLSEGISVYEESQANPTWGQSMNPRYREMILGGELSPVSKLSSAFLEPKSPQHVQLAYYQSSLVVEYLIEAHGLDTLKAVLRDLKAGLPINVALDRRTNGMAALESEFEQFARRKAELLAPEVDWKDPDPAALTSDDPEALEEFVRLNPRNLGGLMHYAQSLVETQQWETAKHVLLKAIGLCPEYAGGESACELLAYVYRRLDETDNERRLLRRHAQLNSTALPVYLRLLELELKAEEWDAVLRTSERILAVNPMLPQPYRARVQAAEALGRTDDAIFAYRTLLALRPEDPAYVHYRLARLLHERRDPLAKEHVLSALEEAPRFRAAHRLLLEISRERN